MTAQLEPQSQAVLNALNATGILPFSQFTAQEARRRILALRAGRPNTTAFPMHEVLQRTIPLDGDEVSLRILRPRASARLPVVVYFHGGGYFAGGLDETDEMVRQIAKAADTVVVNVDYSLSPEAKFPTAINQCFGAFRWVSENAAELNIDSRRIVLAGDSAGGNAAAVLCQMAREAGGPAISLQVLIYPSLDLRRDAPHPSRTRLGGGEYVLSTADIDWMRGLYFDEKSDGSDCRASPLLAATLTALPPALIITADHDPLVDEGMLYAERLAQEGVAVEYVCFEGTFHGFVGYAAALEVGARALDLICDRIRAATAQVTERP